MIFDTQVLSLKFTPRGRNLSDLFGTLLLENWFHTNTTLIHAARES